ncbi:MAG: protealysin inhibitor emfourin [Anaeromyxobacteraceae bacterium]
MRVRFERTGGIAGTRLAIDLEEASLPPDDRAALRDLVQACNFFSLPARLGGGGATRDGFGYRVAVEEGGRAHTVTAGEDGMPEGLCALVDFLAERAMGAR